MGMETIISVLSRVFNVPFSLDAFVLLSLLFQFVLLMAAPLRKKWQGQFWSFISSVYLLESLVARNILGSIPNYNSAGGRTGELRIFWAPFLILHLGGPNTLTSLTLADNEFWHRFASRFVTLSNSFFLVCYRHRLLYNDLLWPTTFMFLAASLRYIEKVVCRFLARLSKFGESTLPRPDAGVNYAELMEVHTSFKDCSAIPTDFKLSSTVDKTPGAAEVAELGRVEILRAAYRLFLEFQGLFVNNVYSYAQRDSVRDYFLRRKAEDAFTICQVELNFAYDVFYTKAILTHHFKYSPLVNLVSLALQLLALLFWIRIDKHNFHHTSVVATYFLVGGSTAHVLLSLLMHFTSDWCLVKLIKHGSGSETRPEGFQSLLSSIYKHRLLLSASLGKTKRSDIPWPKSIPRCNLLSRMVDGNAYKYLAVYRTDVLSQGLRDIIFKELVIRSQSAQPHAAEESCSDRVMWVLALLPRKHQGLSSLEKTFGPWVREVEYEESLILWHIATTLCCYTASGLNEKDANLRKISKTLSDYMLYLLIHNPDMMPPSAGVPALIIYRDTWAEGTRFCKRVLKTPLVRAFPWVLRSEKQLEGRLQEACEKILQVDTHIIPPRRIRDGQSKALLFDACALAKKLQELKVHQWEIISQVLLEMLFYSATYSSPTEHLEKLKSGGDLLTLVWLLMAHLGLGNHFRHKNRRDKTAAFVINKHT